VPFDVERIERTTSTGGLKFSFLGYDAEIEPTIRESIQEAIMAEKQPEIQFRDAIGKWWKRDSGGRLSQLRGPTTKAETATKGRLVMSPSSFWPISAPSNEADQD
jgi:hypothetical protein